MTNRLVLLRHAKAERHVDDDSDFSRPLALRGRENAAVMGRLLVERGLVPDLVLVSAALRTKQTWQRVAAALGEHAARVEYLDELYLPAPDQIVKSVRAHGGDSATVMVVGHEPGLSIVGHRLAGSGESGPLAQVGVGLPTAAAAVLEVEVPWAELTYGENYLVDVFSAR